MTKKAKKVAAPLGTKTIKLTYVEIIVPDNVEEKRAIEILAHGFLDNLQACFGTKEKPTNGYIKIIHNGCTMFVSDT